MPDELYDRDVIAWSEHQADLLRRLARGERMNDVDWLHVVEEIEDVGLSQLNSVQSYLRQMLVHLLKGHGWPDHVSVPHCERRLRRSRPKRRNGSPRPCDRESISIGCMRER